MRFWTIYAPHWFAAITCYIVGRVTGHPSIALAFQLVFQIAYLLGQTLTSWRLIAEDEAR